MKEQQKLFSDLLSRLGFKASTRANATIWRLAKDSSDLHSYSNNSQESDPKKISSLWQLKSCEMIERKGHFAVLNADMALDFARVLKRMSTLERKYWGHRIATDYVKTAKGSCWCLFEFVKNARNKAEPRGVDSEGTHIIKNPILGMAGYQTQLTVSGGHVSLLVSDHFGLGYIPSGFIQNILLFTAESFGVRDKRLMTINKFPQLFSIHEWRIPASTILLRSLLDACEGDSDGKILVDLWRQIEDARGVIRADFMCDSSGGYLNIGNSEEPRSLPYSSASIPSEVLESREKTDDFRQIDSFLYQGKYESAAKKIEDYLDQTEADLPCFRRIALLGISGHRFLSAFDINKKNIEKRTINRSIEAEPNNKLLLSYILKMALDGQESGARLRVLSRLGELLAEQIPNLENLKTFDVVLVEMLGDLWTSEDPQKAEECYLRILQKKGDITRILQKIIQLMRNQGRIEDECSFLERLLKAERRHFELAKIKMRLAEIKSVKPFQREDAVELAISALNLDRTLVEAAFLAAEILVEIGRPDEAIHLLDTRVSNEIRSLNGHRLSKNQELIGKIWLVNKYRPDLALPRYEKAIEFDSSNLSALRVLQNLYREKNDHQNLAQSLELEIEVGGENITFLRIKAIFNEVVALYRGPLENPDKAYDLYLRLVEKSALDPQDIERVLKWDNVSIDWKSLYQCLIDAGKAIPRGEKKGRYLSKIAEISRDKLNDIGASTQHLRDALDEGWIDPQGFSLLVQDLRRAGDFQTLAMAYEKRLVLLSDQDQVPIIQDYFEIPGEIDDQKRDELALRCFSLDRSKDSLIHRRLEYYGNFGDIEGIDRILNMIFLIDDLTLFQKSKWADLCIDVLSECSSEERFRIAQRIFIKKEDVAEDTNSLLHQAVGFFKTATDVSILLPYLKRLLRSQKIPRLDQKIVEKVLHGHDLEMAFYERLLSIDAASPETSASHARISARIFLKLKQINFAEEMLGRVCTLTPCSQGDLEELADMVSSTGNWGLMAKCYEAQIDFEDEIGRKLNLIFSLARIYRENIGEFDKARKIILSSMELSAESIRAKRELAEIAICSGDIEAQELAIVTYLYESQAAKDFDEFSRYFNLLAALGSEKDHLQRIVISHLDYAQKKSRWHVISKLVELASQQKMTHWYIFKLAFLSGLNEEKEDGLTEYWWRGLATVPHLSKAVDFIGETISAAKSFGRMTLIFECFETALRLNAVDRLGPRGKKEILLSYAALLFDDDSKRAKSLQIYQEIYHLDPFDSRSWLPLYFALSEFGHLSDTRAHLESILPKLIKDPSPLKSFPVTIEFLQEELIRLRNTKGGHDKSPTYRSPEVLPESSGSERFALGDLRSAVAKDLLQGAKNLGLPPLPDLGASASASLSAVSAFEKTKDEIQRSRDVGLELGESFDAGGAVLDLKDWSDFNQEEESRELRLVSFLNDPNGTSNNPSVEPALNDSLHLVGTSAAEFSPKNPKSSTDIPKTEGQSSAFIESGAIHEGEVFNRSEVVSSGDFSITDATDTRALDDTHGGRLGAEASLSAERGAAVGDSPPGSLSHFTLDLTGSLRASMNEESSKEFGDGVFDESGENAQTSILDISASSSGVDSSEEVGSQKVSPEFGVSVTLSAEVGGRESLLVTTDLQEEVVNWRQVILTGDFNSDLTKRLLVQAFTSELEKHVALQSVALVAGNVQLLEEGWHWRVWRHSKEYGYPIVGKERFPRNTASPLLQGSLLKLIISLSPLFVQSFPKKFGLEYLGIRLNTQPRTIEKLRKPLAWDQGYLAAVGVHHFARMLKTRNYQAFNIPELGIEIFYDENSKSFYFDEAYYRTRPPSHFFNRFLTLLMMDMGLFSVALKLHPQKDIHFLLSQIKDHLVSSRFAQIKRALMADKSPWGRHLNKIDASLVRAYFDKRGSPSLELVQDTLQAAQLHVRHRVISETLDIIGFFESYINRDFFSDPLGHSEILNISPKVRPLLEFITKLRV